MNKTTGSPPQAARIRLRSYMRPHLAVAVAAPLLMLLEVAMDLLQPRLMARILDEGIIGGDTSSIWTVGGWMLLAALVGLAGGIGCTVFSTLASQRFGADLREGLYRRTMRLSPELLGRFGTGSLVTRLTGDVSQLQQTTLVALRMLARSLFIALGSLVMCIALSPRLSLVLIVTVPALAVLLVWLKRTTVPLFASVQQALDEVNTRLQESLANMRVVKAFVRAPHEEARFGAANDGYRASSLAAARIGALSQPLLSLLLGFTTAAALWYGGALAGSDSIQPGQLAAYLTYLSQLLLSLNGLGNHLLTLSRATASATRIREVLGAKDEAGSGSHADAERKRKEAPEVDPNAARDAAADAALQQGDAPLDDPSGMPESARAAAREAPYLEWSAVAYRYPGSDEYALRGFSLSIRRGESIGIVGMNGSGKSTLALLTAGLLQPTEGSIRLQGKPLGEWDPEELRSKVGLVLQQAHLFSGSIADNIRYGRPDAPESDMLEAAGSAFAAGFVGALPEGYGTRLGQKGVNLSGGQRQRLSIARTLLLKPELLLLDDSTSAVDAATETAITESIERMGESCTLLLVSQKLASLRRCDRIVVLDEGRLAAVGTQEQLLASSPLYRELDESQKGAEPA
ncbi:ABC transporter ATP-binding protein [Paenibacillus pasadenensis]|uniref:ABC transporter ATP-binding protein n=1 Tax=Paenibacillus TaxID=44249 RepID=UPI00041D85C7|nr:MULTISPECIES: ABC transporter ATP-binding protein [Paenibacillus]QGG56377.1 ATP-binding cassette domain-containing protein [Paenibacillus sp. B01]